MDAGYIGHADEVIERGYAPHIRSRGEKKSEKMINPNLEARRWVVEVVYSWIDRFRKLLAGFEKKKETYFEFLYFSCAIVVWKKILKVHQS
jgi:hypothetical protein